VVDKLSEAIRYAQVDIVPKTVVNMGGNSDSNSNNSGTNTVMDTLLKFITIDKLGVSLVTNEENQTNLKNDDLVEKAVEEKSTEEKVEA